ACAGHFRELPAHDFTTSSAYRSGRTHRTAARPRGGRAGRPRVTVHPGGPLAAAGRVPAGTVRHAGKLAACRGCVAVAALSLPVVVAAHSAGRRAALAAVQAGRARRGGVAGVAVRAAPGTAHVWRDTLGRPRCPPGPGWRPCSVADERYRF